MPQDRDTLPRIEHKIYELSVGETHRAQEAMCALRTTQEAEHDFVKYVDGVLRPMGYRLVGALAPGDEQAAAVAGFDLATAWRGDTTCTSMTSRRDAMLGVTASAEPSSTGCSRRDDGSDAASCT